MAFDIVAVGRGGICVYAAIVSASSSVVVAVVVFVLNQWSHARREHRQTRLAIVSAQIRDLFGPLKVAVESNEEVWRALRASKLPDGSLRRGADPTDGERATWSSWFEGALMPENRRIRDLILTHSDLIPGDDLPDVLRDFCAHVAACEVALARQDEPEVLIGHPGAAFVEYVRSTFADLRAKQAALLDSIG
ncbi:hypothetical protein ACPPVO_55645 [Dactylosporangium sp. McL0621]|uniref:hypothetical protein n=1 Tax=Dactylosporangium sp. McL0621 TaxID=3415678 RepID=UPI003CF92D60